MTEHTCWDLIMMGKFEEAMIVADNEYILKKDRLTLNNKCLALLALKKYEEAIEVSESLITNSIVGESDSDYKKKGVALWFLDRKQEAIGVWKSALNTPYTDAAGGVEVPALLFFAAVMTSDVKLRKESMKLLRRRVKSKRIINWPGAIASYLLGDIDEQTLLAGISTQPSLQSRGLCQANFYIAVKCLESGDIERARALVNEIHQLPKVAMLHMEFYLSDAII